MALRCVRGGILGALVLALVATFSAAATPAHPMRAGRAAGVYRHYCASCHGEAGDGHGTRAARMDPGPPDLTKGVYKYRSTPSGTLPTDDDLFRIITLGLYHSEMRGYAALALSERRDLVEYLKSLSPRFATEPQGTPIRVPSRPVFDRALAERGHQIWSQAQCSRCHGESGRGDGLERVVDASGRAIAPADLTRSPLRSGGAPEDVYRTLMTGLDGTPMRSFADRLTPDEAWSLVAYVTALRNESSSATELPRRGGR
jgi:mono/diheme cytochrome c family protein